MALMIDFGGRLYLGAAFYFTCLLWCSFSDHTAENRQQSFCQGISRHRQWEKRKEVGLPVKGLFPLHEHCPLVNGKKKKIRIIYNL